MDAAPGEHQPSRSKRVGEVARLFLTLGVIGFGGPAAHVALMRDEVVTRRRWVDDAEFLDLVGATNLIPGPNSTELAIHLGHRRAGGRGLVIAGVCFIAPAVLIVGFVAWLYERHGTDPAVLDLRYGILPVVIAVVAHALHGLGRAALTDIVAIVVALAALAAYAADVHELLILAAGGGLAVLWSSRHHLRPDRALALLLVPFATSSAAARPTGISRAQLFAVFLEIGSVLYGSGYVLLAFLERNLVDERGWLTEQQLLDAITVGQVTPGPLFTSATFVGWQIDGPIGASLATAGIFLPSFVFVALLGRIVPWMRRHPTARAFLHGVTAASLGLMTGVVVELADAALIDGYTVAIALAALGVLLWTRCNNVWLVACGVAIGVIHALAA